MVAVLQLPAEVLLITLTFLEAAAQTLWTFQPHRAAVSGLYTPVPSLTETVTFH